MRRQVVGWVFVLAAIAGAGFIARPYAHGLSLVARAADLQGPFRRLADFDAEMVGQREVQIPLSGESLRARVYEPAGGAQRTALLVPGLHPYGIDEPRFMRLSRELSASGIAVVTPDIPDLARFTIVPGTTDAIEQAAAWLASQPSFAPDGRIGMIGVSFGGGLTLVAAGRPALRDRVAYVLSFGGHADLPRVLRYLCTGAGEPPPGGGSRLDGLRLSPGRTPGVDRLTQPPPPHDYGVALVLLGLADRVVPARQVDTLRAAVRRFLVASALDRVDPAAAAVEFQALRTIATKLPEPSATLLGYVNDRDVVHLGARLIPHLNTYGSDPALSPVRASDRPTATVFLLHGIADNVIPAAESVHLSAALRGIAPVRLLLTELISHAAADRPAGFSDVMNLSSFWGDLLNR
jgi:dienelactone hydrolase